MSPSETIKALQNLRSDGSVKQVAGKSYENHLDRVLNQAQKIQEKEYADIFDYSEKITSEKPDDVLDPSLDTIPYTLMLHGKVRGVTQKTKSWPGELVPNAPLWQRLVSFLYQFDRVEIRWVGSQWRWLVECVSEAATYSTSMKTPGDPQGLRYATNAMLRLDPSGATFTTTHLIIAQDALSTGYIDQILPLLDKELTSLAKKSGANVEDVGQGITVEDCPSCVFISQDIGFSDKMSVLQIQEYFILGALAYIYVENWPRAILFLEHVLATPASNLATGFMVEAYKKWILLNLISRGNLSVVPSVLSQNNLKWIRAMSKPYIALKDAFVADSYSKLLAEVIEGNHIWHDEGNAGLVQRLLADHRRRTVIKMGAVYSTVPMKTVAERLDVTEAGAEKWLGDLAVEGKIDATLERSQAGSTILRFHDKSLEGSTAQSEAQLCEKLVERTQHLEYLAEAVGRVDQQLSMTKEYIDYTRKTRRNKVERQHLAGEEDTMELLGPSDDEELMGDS